MPRALYSTTWPVRSATEEPSSVQKSRRGRGSRRAVRVQPWPAGVGWGWLLVGWECRRVVPEGIFEGPWKVRGSEMDLVSESPSGEGAT